MACPMCQGKRGIASHPAGPATVLLRSCCPRCIGTGWQVAQGCVSCGGTGSRSVRFSVSVRVPPGTDTGMPHSWPASQHILRTLLVTTSGYTMHPELSTYIATRHILLAARSGSNMCVSMNQFRSLVRGMHWVRRLCGQHREASLYLGAHLQAPPFALLALAMAGATVAAAATYTCAAQPPRSVGHCAARGLTSSRKFQ